MTRRKTAKTSQLSSSACQGRGHTGTCKMHCRIIGLRIGRIQNEEGGITCANPSCQDTNIKQRKATDYPHETHESSQLWSCRPSETAQGACKLYRAETPTKNCLSKNNGTESNTVSGCEITDGQMEWVGGTIDHRLYMTGGWNSSWDKSPKKASSSEE